MTMRLIDEIEAEAQIERKAWNMMEATEHQRDCYWLIENDKLWPHIKAALESGENMLELLERNGVEHPCMASFRAATGREVNHDDP